MGKFQSTWRTHTPNSERWQPPGSERRRGRPEEDTPTTPAGVAVHSLSLAPRHHRSPCPERAHPGRDGPRAIVLRGGPGTLPSTLAVRGEPWVFPGCVSSLRPKRRPREPVPAFMAGAPRGMGATAWEPTPLGAVYLDSHRGVGVCRGPTPRPPPWPRASFMRSTRGWESPSACDRSVTLRRPQSPRLSRPLMTRRLCGLQDGGGCLRAAVESQAHGIQTIGEGRGGQGGGVRAPGGPEGCLWFLPAPALLRGLGLPPALGSGWVPQLPPEDTALGFRSAGGVATIRDPAGAAPGGQPWKQDN